MEKLFYESHIAIGMLEGFIASDIWQNNEEFNNLFPYYKEDGKEWSLWERGEMAIDRESTAINPRPNLAQRLE